jgi:hypothetical protein
MADSKPLSTSMGDRPHNFALPFRLASMQILLKSDAILRSCRRY